MKSKLRSWSIEERREIGFLALLPLAGAALVTLALFAGSLRLPLPFFFAVICAYVSTFLGVMPVLVLFRRLGWQQWHHYAIAGYLGVVFLWLVPFAVLRAFQHGAQIAQTSSEGHGLLTGVTFLSIPGAIAAVGAVVFWYFCRRGKVSANDA
jgi:hypothetical protein